jgi:hypothetical protein
MKWKVSDMLKLINEAESPENIKIYRGIDKAAEDMLKIAKQSKTSAKKLRDDMMDDLHSELISKLEQIKRMTIK